jgi:hypothetical protein
VISASRADRHSDFDDAVAQLADPIDLGHHQISTF